MKATLVPDRLTPLTAAQVTTAFREAFVAVEGTEPSRDCLALLVAQSALETGRWKSIHCFNLGNVKASPTYEGLYCMFRCNEVINGKVIWFDPPHPQTFFRAFASLDDGALDHIRFLAGRKRYAAAWEAAKTGMPLAFVDALSRAGYFTADANSYARAVVSLWHEFRRTAQMGDDGDTRPDVPSFPTLRLGATGEAVKRVQAKLNSHGAQLVVDGRMGPLTVLAVQSFQRRAGLDADGVVGSRTWAALEST